MAAWGGGVKVAWPSQREGGYGIRLSDPDNLASPSANRPDAVGRGRFAGAGSLLSNNGDTHSEKPLLADSTSLPPHPCSRSTTKTPFFKEVWGPSCLLSPGAARRRILLWKPRPTGKPHQEVWPQVQLQPRRRPRKAPRRR